jgi:hypothetical protein
MAFDFVSAFLVPAVSAGAVAIVVTRTVEFLGGRRGGVLGTAPTTIVPASVAFYANAVDEEAFRDAMWVVPSGMLLSALFLWLWRVLPPRIRVEPLALRLSLVSGASLGLWCVAALAVVAGVEVWQTAGGSMPWFAIGTFIFAWVVGLASCWVERPAPVGSRRVSRSALLARGGMAALAVGTAVAMQGIAGPFVAGVLSVFPAIFLTTMVSLWWSQGEAVHAGAVGPMMLGSTAVSAYALIATVSLPMWGAGWGATAAWFLSVLLVTVPSALLLERRPWDRSAMKS